MEGIPPVPLGVNRVICGDCLHVLQSIPDGYVDLAFGSPPYEDARTYGIDFNLKGQEWVDWMVEVYKESLRVCKGLVAFVIQGRTRKYRWSATPALLMASLHRAGINLRNPPLYQRSGIPGSGGPDWLRSDYEWIVCASHPGRLPWSNNTACGNLPKCKPGGNPTHRKKDGTRVRIPFKRSKDKGGSTENYLIKDTVVVEYQKYKPPKITNPGNVIHCSGGHLGSKLAHENEAPFPEKLPEFFIRSFCPPGGIVLDPFSGSGTTAAVAVKNNRKFIAIDIRQSQVDWTRKRINGLKEQQSDQQ
jgi:site-specific DNA-methyltransferase (adenine-specific)